jgi:hypothetical protein
MKVLLDECVTRLIKRDLSGHDVGTVEQAGLKGLKNSALLRAAAARFDVLLTVDQGIPYQQNLGSIGIAVIILVARSNAYPVLKPWCQSSSRLLLRSTLGMS